MTTPILARPDHIVEANFFNTQDGQVWSNLTDWVELQHQLTVSRRRQTVFDEVAPATFQVYLDNKDGTFNNDQPTSAFYNTVNVDTDIRFRLRWPIVGDGTGGTTRNMLSDYQSAGTDATKFTADQGNLDIDDGIPASNTIDDVDPSIVYNPAWSAPFADANAYNGSYTNTPTSGLTATCTFFGTGIEWHGIKGPNRGIASVAIDGGTATNFDLYQATQVYQATLFSVTGLALGWHTIVITNTGTKNVSSSNTFIDIDFMVITNVASPPTGQTSDIIWTTGVLDQTGVGFLTGIGPSRGPDDHPVYVLPSTSYSARAQVKCDPKGTGITFKVSLRMRWYDLQGNFISDSSSSLATLTTSYQAVSVTATSPSNAAMVRVGVFNETTVGPATRTIVYTGNDSQTQRNSQGATVIVPTSAMVGDLAMVWHRISNVGSITTTAPSGWSLHHSQADANGTTYLYTKIINASDINKAYQWISSSRCKHELLLATYSGVNQGTPIHQFAKAAETVFRTGHTTPNVTTTVANCWILSAVFDTSTTTTSWSAPVGESIRVIQYTTGGNVPNGLATDDATAHAAGTYGSKVFTSNASSRYATMHTVALNPATGTGPGNVTVQAGAFELVAGSLSSWQQGGHWESKFTGLVDQWAETFAGDAVLTNVQATDRQKVLNTINVGPAIYEDIRDSGPIAYYQLNESGTSGSTTQEAANSADVSQPTLTQVKFGTGLGASSNAPLQWGSGTGPGTDGTSALITNPADKNNGLGIQAVLTNPLANDSAVTLLTFFNSSAANDGSTHVMLRLQDPTNGQNNKVAFDLRGQPATSLQARCAIQSESASYISTATVSAQYFDGHTHMLAATFQLTGGQLVSTIYIDGVNTASATVACPVSQFPTASVLGVANSVVSATPLLFSGTLSHAVVFDYALDDATIADLWTAGSTAFAGDTVDQRISRLAAWENQGGMNLDSTTTVLDRHMPDTQTLLSAFQQAARSEGGTFYIDGEGENTFKSRIDKESTYIPLLTVKASQVDPSSFTKVDDDTLLVNKPVITRLGSGVKATVSDLVSQNNHGVHEKDIDTILSSDADAKNYATYLLAFYSEPSIRCDQVKISALFLNDWADVLLIDMWQVIRITNMPSTEASPTLDLYIEGWEFKLDPDTWDMIFDTSTAIPFGITSAPVRGVCGQSVVAW